MIYFVDTDAEVADCDDPAQDRYALNKYTTNSPGIPYMAATAACGVGPTENPYKIKTFKTIKGAFDAIESDSALRGDCLKKNEPSRLDEFEEVKKIDEIVKKI